MYTIHPMTHGTTQIHPACEFIRRPLVVWIDPIVGGGDGALRRRVLDSVIRAGAGGFLEQAHVDSGAR